MRRIADLVSIHADITRLDALVPGNEILSAEGRLFAKTLAHGRQQAFQESIAASELHFEEQALRFVNRR